MSNTNTSVPPPTTGGPLVLNTTGNQSVPPPITGGPILMNTTSSPSTPNQSKPPPTTNGGSLSRALSPTTMAAVTAISSTSDIRSEAIQDDDFSSSIENIRGHSNTSSVQVTPTKKQQTFPPRISTSGTYSSQLGGQTSVLACQLALLAALTAEMESSVDTFEKEQWRTRIFQVNQVMQMVQWEANGLYGLGDN